MRNRHDIWKVSLDVINNSFVSRCVSPFFSPFPVESGSGCEGSTKKGCQVVFHVIDRQSLFNTSSETYWFDVKWKFMGKLRKVF